MRTANPALNDNVFSDSVVRDAGETMTINGTVNRAGFLILLVIASAWFSWSQSTSASGVATPTPYIGMGALGGFIVALITIFAKQAPITSPIYAVLEGLFLGGISAFSRSPLSRDRGPGDLCHIRHAVRLLIAYRSGLIKATENFKLGFRRYRRDWLLYLITFVLSFFGKSIP